MGKCDVIYTVISEDIMNKAPMFIFLFVLISTMLIAWMEVMASHT